MCPLLVFVRIFSSLYGTVPALRISTHIKASILAISLCIKGGNRCMRIATQSHVTLAFIYIHIHKHELILIFSFIMSSITVIVLAQLYIHITAIYHKNIEWHNHIISHRCQLGHANLFHTWTFHGDWWHTRPYQSIAYTCANNYPACNSHQLIIQSSWLETFNIIFPLSYQGGNRGIHPPYFK